MRMDGVSPTVSITLSKSSAASQRWFEWRTELAWRTSQRQRLIDFSWNFQRLSNRQKSTLSGGDDQLPGRHRTSASAMSLSARLE